MKRCDLDTELMSDGWPLEFDASRTHSLTTEAPPSREAWAQIWRWESLQRPDRGCWADHLLPASPLGFLLGGFVLCQGLLALGAVLAPDLGVYVSTPDIYAQPLFLLLHFACVRAMSGLYTRGLDPSLAGLGVDRAERERIRTGLVGWRATIGSVVCALPFMLRDLTAGLADGTNGLTAFDDPSRWDLAGLGHGAQRVLLGVWSLEWLLFGVVLWGQIWISLAVIRALLRANLQQQIFDILVHDRYREFFTLVSRGATICLVFAVGNLLFIAMTGELLPKDPARLDGIETFLTEMSDLLSTGLLFAVLILGFVGTVVATRWRFTLAVNQLYARTGDAALQEMDRPLNTRGSDGLELLRHRVEVTSQLLKALALQREIDVIGRRGINGLMLKALVPMITIGLRVSKMLTGG